MHYAGIIMTAIESKVNEILRTQETNDAFGVSFERYGRRVKEKGKERKGKQKIGV